MKTHSCFSHQEERIADYCPSFSWIWGLQYWWKNDAQLKNKDSYYSAFWQKNRPLQNLPATYTISKSASYLNILGPKPSYLIHENQHVREKKKKPKCCFLLYVASKNFKPCCNYHQFSSITQSCPTLCDPMNRSMPGLPVYHQLPEFTQTHVHRVGGAIQLSHPLSSPSPPAPNPSQHQGLFQWVNS